MTSKIISRRNFIAASAGLAAAPMMPRTALGQVDLMSKEAVLFDPNVPVLGNPDGDVTIIEWFDYQCPYCKRAHPDVMSLVREDGHIRLVMKDWPIFGAPSLYASRLSLAAGDHHAEALTALMATEGRLTADIVDRVLRQAGFDVNALNIAYEENRTQIDGILQRNSIQAEAFNLFGTPAYIIGTTLFPGVMEMADMRQAVVRARQS